jgi:hypothetical protein
MTIPTWPPQPSHPQPAQEQPSGPMPLERLLLSKRPSARWPVIGAAAGGLIVGLTVGAMATTATTSSRPAAAPPVTRTVTVTAAPSVSLPATTSAPAPVSTEVAEQTQGPLRSLGPGTYEVGTGPGQAAPGKYKSTGPDGDNIVGCYYSRMRNNDGSIGDIINNNISQGPSVFTIKPSDGYVEINGCTFTRA